MAAKSNSNGNSGATVVQVVSGSGSAGANGRTIQVRVRVEMKVGRRIKLRSDICLLKFFCALTIDLFFTSQPGQSLLIMTNNGEPQRKKLKP